MNAWTALLRSPPPSLALVHELGGPDDPSSIWGRERVTVRADGVALLEWSQGGRTGAVEARVEPRVVRRWAALLAEGGFPELPKAPLTPGASARFFEVHLGDRAARAPLSRFHYEDEPPFEELCGIADTVAAVLRGRPGPEDPVRRAVRDVRAR